MGFSGSKNLQELSSRINPVYGIIFTSLLYLTIGPFFALPRTGTASFEIGALPFIGDLNPQIGLLLYTAVFFGLTLWYSLRPAKIVDNVGKYLAPGIVIGLAILLFFVVFKPMGVPEAPQVAYETGAFFKGFTEGYNTMDALASLVFAIIVINSLQRMGVKSKKGILKATALSGTVAIVILAFIYVGISYLGATSTSTFGLFDNGGPVLSNVSTHYFGIFGTILLAIVMFLACLTTAIGLTTANAEYFHTLFPKISYKVYVIIFATFSFGISNVGLSNLITFSVPVLMLLYPLAITLIALTFLSPLFKHAKFVYVSVTVVALLIGIVDGLTTLCKSLGIENFKWLQPIVDLYKAYLPLYAEGLGWLVPVLIVLVVTGTIARFSRTEVLSTKEVEVN